MLLRMLWRNTFRHKLRTSLTLVGITIAILAFGTLRTVIDAWYAGVEASSSTRLVTRNAVSLVFPMPLFYRERIRQVEGVIGVSHGNWFGGYYIEPKNFFANFAMSLPDYLALYPEFLIDPDQRITLLRDRKGAVVGKKLADRFGWKLGETITLKGTIFPGDWPLTLRAIYRGRDPTVDETQLIFHWDYLNETMKRTVPRRADQIGFFVIGIQDAKQAAHVAATIDQQFKNSNAETLTETEKAFQLSFVSMTEAILDAIRLVSIVVIVIILAVVANTMAMSVRERLWEYAVFKTLGFGGWRIAGIIFGESLVLTLVGGGLGIALTFPAAALFRRALGQFFPVFEVSPLTIQLSLAAAVAVGVLAALFPARQALRVRIADGLRRLG
jgi:putative ABC transport system permease protein